MSFVDLASEDDSRAPRGRDDTPAEAFRPVHVCGDSVRLSLVWVLGLVVACGPKQGTAVLIATPDCRQPLAPRINVRPAVTTPGFTALLLDATSNVPLQEARIEVPELNWAASTDSMGFARLARLQPGIYTVRARAVGYKVVTDTITIPPGGGRFLIFQLVLDRFCFS